MTTVLYLGSKDVGARCLQVLIDHGADVVGVHARRATNAVLEGPRAVADVASSAGVAIVDDLERAPRADLLVSVQHGAVLTPEQLALGDRAVNLHLAPLPEYRGANQFTYAILDRATWFGVTVHEMVARVDAGAILAERQFDTDPVWTAWDLRQVAVDQAVALFDDVTPALLAGTLEGVDQRDVRPGGPRHFHRKDEVIGLKRLDPSWAIDRIDLHVRALDMPGFEPAYFEHEGRRLYVTTRWGKA